MTGSIGTAPDTWVGSIVLSLAGRDGKRLFVVVAIDEADGYVYLADGKLRQIQHPKKKKSKHIQWMKKGDAALVEACLNGTVTNRQLKETLTALCF